jgi:YidC/Oxa1 family membrane protein insertase
MLNLLYTIIIFPIEQIIELCFYFTLRFFHNPALAVLGVSIGFSLFTLPLYFRAEHWQSRERDIEKKLSTKVKKIKAAFSGDEQYMMLSAYYTQNHYHPVYALRASLGILIQVPFFIAAYHYLSNLAALQGVHFLFIKDLGVPDGAIKIGGGGGINILPVLMTFINCISGAIHTKGFPRKDKVQLYGMAAIFLVLLYNSPAGLVLYWTCNNLFSLIKNIFQKTKNAKKIIYIIIFIIAAILDINLLFFHIGDLPNRLLVMMLVSTVYLIPFISASAKRIVMHGEAFCFRTYLLSCGTFFLLIGIVIPSALIASSVEEFSFVGSYTTPFPFIWTTAVQSAGIFIFWASALYLLFSDIVRKSLAFIVFFLSIIALVDTFLVAENFGFLTNMLVFSDVKPFVSNPAGAVLSIVLPIAAVIAAFLFWRLKKFRVLETAQWIFLMALAVSGIMNMVQISRGYTIALQKKNDPDTSFSKVYSFSKNGTNVLLVMLDCVIGSYMPSVFEEKPELLEIFSDFTLYPNTVSFSNHTMIGALPIYGGYEYTPQAINERTDTTLLEKQKEAYLLLPELFANKDFSVTVTDPPFDNHQMSNLSIFENDKRINAQNITGRLTASWLQKHPDINAIQISEILRDRLIRFSFFKTAPLILRSFIYDAGDWLAPGANGRDITPTIIDDYALLDLLPDITAIQNGGDTYTAIYAHLSHENIFLEAPLYKLAQTVTDRGSSPLKDDSRYHVTIASFIMLFNYFQYLKAEGVYDNTRIILVSDHGRGGTNSPENIVLPNGDRVQTYNALLMVKDFTLQKEQGPRKLRESFDFMTNADAALFAVDGLIEAARNPWTQYPLKAGKENGAAIATTGPLSTYRHSKYTYSINNNQWLHVHDNIFDADNWRKGF